MHHDAHLQPQATTVLIIEDDAEMRAMLRDLLETDGFRVEESGGGDGALGAMESASPHLVVLDREMPGRNGLELLLTIRASHPRVPVVVITAFGGPSARAEALRRGATSYLEKPFRAATLLGTVRALTRGPAPSDEGSRVEEERRA
jgi:two-component system response regulator FlrC